MRKHRDSCPVRVVIGAFALLLALPTHNSPGKEPRATDSHEREELGVNSFTAPSISQIFHQLDALSPLPFETVKRQLPEVSAGTTREQLGLVFGGLIADGFLIVDCQKQSFVDPLGRALLRLARSLGVGDRVMRHSASLTDHSKRGDWSAVRHELVTTQTDVEQAMVAMRDQKMAHLIGLGGWLRGLEICASAVESAYTPERARLLQESDLIDYFAEEIQTLPPSLASSPLFIKLRGGISIIRGLFNQPATGELSLSEVRAVRAKATELNMLILTGE